MIDFTVGKPLDQAIEELNRKTPVGSLMRTAQWESLPKDLRDQAFFSAGVESVRLLEEMKRRLKQRIALERDRLSEGATMDRSRFVKEMQEMAQAMGLRPDVDDAERGSLTDIGSQRRLELIWNVQVEMAQGRAKYLAGLNPDSLEAAPAQELVRVAGRREWRNWPRRWKEAGGKLIQGPGDYGVRMVAHKLDPIWERINRFGNPYPPFDFGSGMGLRNVRWREANELGVLNPPSREAGAGTEATGTVIPEAKAPKLQVSVEDWSEDGRSLVQRITGGVQDGHTLRMTLRDESLKPDPNWKAPPFDKNKVMPFDGKSQPSPVTPSLPLSEQIKVDLPEVFQNDGTRELIRERIHLEVTNTTFLKAAKLIGTVFQDGILPALHIESWSVGQIGEGCFNVDKRGRRCASLKPGTFLVSAIHEIGHWLDQDAFHTPSANRRMASEGQPELRELMDTISSTSTIRRIIDSRNISKSKLEEAEDYLLMPAEMFARAFVQFIASETNDKRLAAEIKYIRFISPNHFWSEKEFDPVGHCFRQVLRKKGWLKDPQRAVNCQDFYPKRSDRPPRTGYHPQRPAKHNAAPLLLRNPSLLKGQQLL